MALIVLVTVLGKSLCLSLLVFIIIVMSIITKSYFSPYFRINWQGPIYGNNILPLYWIIFLKNILGSIQQYLFFENHIASTNSNWKGENGQNEIRVKNADAVFNIFCKGSEMIFNWIWHLRKFKHKLPGYQKFLIITCLQIYWSHTDFIFGMCTCFEHLLHNSCQREGRTKEHRNKVSGCDSPLSCTFHPSKRISRSI